MNFKIVLFSVINLLLILSCQKIYAQVNLFTNAEQTEDWNDPLNWSLGVVPTVLHDVTLTVGVTLKLKTGDTGVAHSITLSGNDTLIVQDGAFLAIYDEITILNSGFFSNRGMTTFSVGSSGFHILEGGSMTNQDTIVMNQPQRGFDFDGGTIINNGLININNPFHEGILMYPAAVSPNPRKFNNNINGVINITAPNGYGIFLSDTLNNNGTVFIQNVLRDVPIIEANCIYIHVTGELYNDGLMTLQTSDDDGLKNDGVLKNLDNGSFVITGFDKDGLVNNFSLENFGDILIVGSDFYPLNAGLKNSNTLQLRGGSMLEISGTNVMEYGIHNNYPFTIDTNANILIRRTNNDAIFDMGSITNHGTIEVSELVDTLAYGIVNFLPFNNYGNITMSDMGSGVRVMDGVFNNYGNMTFTNLISKAIFATSLFNNYVGGLINVINTDENRISTGIIFADVSDFQNKNFSNYGIINIDSSHVGIHVRQGTFLNTGNILINHFRQALEIDFTNNLEVPYFINDGDLWMHNHEEPLTSSVEVDNGETFTQNFQNTENGRIEFLNIHRGMDLNTGMINYGNISFENVTQWCFRLNNHEESHTIINQFGGEIDIMNAPVAIRFGNQETFVNLNYFVNYGLFKMKMMTDTAIIGISSTGTFENYGTVIGDAVIDCSFATVNSFYRPGQPVGMLRFLNYQSYDNASFFIQVKGTGGMGNPNGHDAITSDSAVELPNNLDVEILPGYTPQIGDMFVIVESDDTISNEFDFPNLPFIGGGKMFELEYKPTEVVLHVVASPVYWVGNCDSIWTNPCNWLGNTVPDSIHTVIISGDVQHFPKLHSGSFSVGNGSGTQRCRRLILLYGGFLETNGIPVSVSNRIQNAGILRFLGNQPVVCEEEAEIVIESGGLVEVK